MAHTELFVLCVLIHVTVGNHVSSVNGVLCNHAPYWTVGADVYVVEGSGSYTLPGKRWSPMIHDGQPSIPGGMAGAPGACPVGTMRDPSGLSGPCCLDTTADVACGMGTICPLLVGQNECSCRQQLNFAITATPNLFCAGPSIIPCWPQWGNPACSTNPAAHCSDPNDLGTADLTFTPCPCAFGTSVVCVTLCDDAHLTGASQPLGLPPNLCGDDNCAPRQCFTIHIEQKNNCPTWNAVTPIQANEDDVRCVRVANNVNPGCTNEGPGAAHQQDLYWKWTCSNDALFEKTPQIIYRQGDTTADLCYTPTRDMSGCSTCTITLHDTGGTANGGCDMSPPQDVTLCINEINDPPSFVPGPTTITIDEDAANSCNPSGCASSVWSYENWASNRKIGPGWEVCAEPGTCCQSATCNPRQVLTRFDVSFANPCYEVLFEELPRIDVLTGDLTMTLSHHANTPGSRTVELDVTLHDSGLDSGGCLLVNDLSCHQSHSNTVRLTLIIQPENDHPSFDPAFPSINLIEDEVYPPTIWATNMCIGGWSSGDCANHDCKGTCPPTAGCCPGAACACNFCNEQGGPENQAFVWDISVDNMALFTAAGQPALSLNGQLTFTLATDVNGVARIRTTLKDDGGNFGQPAIGNTAELVVKVLPKNDQPQFTLTPSHSTVVCNPCEQHVVPRFVTFIDTGSTWTDEDTQTLQWVTNPPTVNNNNPALFKQQPTLQFSGDGTTADLYFTPADGASGTVTVRVTLKDSGDNSECTPAPVTADCVCNGGAAAPRKQSCDSLTQEFTLTIGNTNLPPSFIIGHDGDVIVTEDPVPSAVVISPFSTHTAGSTQEDATQTVTYIVDTADTSLFSAGGQPAIDALGRLTFTPAPNANGVTTLSIKVRDNGAPPLETEYQTITLRVLPVNDAPSFTHPPNLPPPPGPTAYSTCTADTGCPHSVSFATGLILGPADEVTQKVLATTVNCPNHPSLLKSALLVAATGELAFTLNKDQHTSGAPSVCSVVVQDNGGTDLGGEDTFTTTVTIAVNSNDPPPVFSVGAAGVMKEDDPTEVFRQGIVSIQSTTPVTGTCGAGSVIVKTCTVNTINGDISITLEGEMNGDEDVAVRLCNAGGCTDKVFPLQVVPVNDPPILRPIPDVVVREALGVTSETVPTATEVVNLGDGTHFYKILVASSQAGPNSTAGPTETDQNVVYHVNTDSMLFAAPPTIDANGYLTFTTKDIGSAVLRVVAQDDGGTLNGGSDRSAERSFTINVERFNTAPTFVVLVPVVTAVEADTPTTHTENNFLGSITPGLYPTEASQQLSSTISCESSCDGVLGAASSVAMDTRGLVLHLNKDRFTPSGGCVCSVIVSDDGPQGGGHRHQSSPVNFTLVIPNTNDVPTFVIGPNQVTTVDETLVAPQWIDPSTISAGPFEDYQTLRFEPSFDEALLSSVNVGLDGDLTVVPRSGKIGLASVDLCLVDSENGKTCDTFLVNVLPDGIMGKPTFDAGQAVTVDEDSLPYLEQWATNPLTGNPADTTRALRGFQLRVLSGAEVFSTGGMPSIDSSGTLTFTLAPDMNGPANVEVILEEVNGMASIPQQLLITVRPINDVPFFTPGGPITVLEDSTGHNAVWCSSVSAGAPNEEVSVVRFTVSPRDSTLFTVQPSINKDCFLSFTLADDRYGDTVLSIVLGDGELETSAIQLSVEVLPVNDAPSWEVPVDSLYLTEDFGKVSRTFGSKLFAGSYEGEQSMTVAVEVVSGGDIFAVPPTTEVRDSSASLLLQSAANRYGTAVLTLKLRDTGGTANGGKDSADPVQLVVVVRDVNDPPLFEVPTTITLLEDTPTTIPNWVYSSTAGPYEDVQLLSWETANTKSDVVKLTIDNGSLVSTMTQDGFGEGVATIKVTDGNPSDPTFRALTFDTEVRFVVEPVNDPPTFVLTNATISSPALGTYSGKVLADISAGPPNEASQKVTLSAVATDPAMLTEQPQITADGALTFKTASKTGQVGIKVTATDNGGVANGGSDTSQEALLSVTITSNAALLFTTEGVVQTAPGTYNSKWVTSTSNTQGAVTYTVTPVSGAALFSTQPAVSPSGFLTFTTVPEAVGTATYNVALSDGVSSVQQVLQINVLPAKSRIQLITYMSPSEVSQEQWKNVIGNHLSVPPSSITIESVAKDGTSKTPSGASVIVSVDDYKLRDSIVTAANSVNEMSTTLRLYNVAESGCVIVVGDSCFPVMACADHKNESACVLKSLCSWSGTQCLPNCNHFNSKASCEVYPGVCLWDGVLCRTACSQLSFTACVGAAPRCSWSAPVCGESVPSSDDGLPSWVIPVAIAGGVIAMTGLIAALVYHTRSDPNDPKEVQQVPSHSTQDFYTVAPPNPIEQTFSSPAHPLHPPQHLPESG